MSWFARWIFGLGCIFLVFGTFVWCAVPLILDACLDPSTSRFSSAILKSRAEELQCVLVDSVLPTHACCVPLIDLEKLVLMNLNRLVSTSNVSKGELIALLGIIEDIRIVSRVDDRVCR